MAQDHTGNSLFLRVPAFSRGEHVQEGDGGVQFQGDEIPRIWHLVTDKSTAMTIQVFPLHLPSHPSTMGSTQGNPGMWRAARAGNTDGFGSRDEAKPMGKGSAFPPWNYGAPGLQGEQGLELRTAQPNHQIPPFLAEQPRSGLNPIFFGKRNCRVSSQPALV